jgi:hypothetical protein
MRPTSFAVAVLAAISFIGCASTRTDLVRSGYVTLEPRLTKTLPNVPNIYEEDGSLVVDGQLDDSAATQGGHVDVQVVAPDGVVVYDAQVDYRRHVSPAASTPGRRGRLAQHRVSDHYHYAVRFPGLPPAGSVVRVVFDPRPHEEKLRPGPG